MTKVKIENFQAKKVKIENFELQKRYIPQNKAEIIYNKISNLLCRRVVAQSRDPTHSLDRVSSKLETFVLLLSQYRNPHQFHQI